MPNSRDGTGVTAPAITTFAAPMTIKMPPTVHPNARSLPALVGSSSR
jgi:hypothetical protein